MGRARGTSPAKLPVLQPDDPVACPLLTAGVMRAKTCAERQHARATGSPRGARYNPCSYLIQGERAREIVFRCEVGKEALYRLPSEWWPKNWKPKQASKVLVAKQTWGRRRWYAEHLPKDKIDGRSV